MANMLRVIAPVALTSAFAGTLWLTQAGCENPEAPVYDGSYVDAGSDISVNDGIITVNEGDDLILDGAASVQGSPTTEPHVSYRWDADFGDSPEPTITEDPDDPLDAILTAPFVNGDTDYQVTFTGIHDNNTTDTDSITVRVIETGALGPTIEIIGSLPPFVHIIGGSPCPQSIGSFEIGNAGGGDFNYCIESTPAWVSISGSTCGSAGDTVPVVFNCNVGGPGGLAGDILVEGDNGSGSASVPVSGSVQ